MSITEIYHQFITGLQQTGPVEFIAVIAGIASVWFSWKENILVYPVGLLNTIFSTYLSVKGHLFGEASVNIYYTVMSIYGWMLWAKKDRQKQEHVLHISGNSKKDWLLQIAFFGTFYIVIFSCLTWLKNSFAPEAIPWADAFASATAYTGMWLMARKKLASWYWWVATNIVSIPLYFVKGYVFMSFQYVILLIMAVGGFLEWRSKWRMQQFEQMSKEQGN